MSGGWPGSTPGLPPTRDPLACPLVPHSPAATALLAPPVCQTEHVVDPATGKSFEKLHLAGEYTWLTYNQLAEKVEAFATGLVAATGVAKGEPVVIYAETKADWMV